MIEVAHEALLREWPLLRRLLEADKEFLVGKRQLADDLAIRQAAPPNRRAEALLSGLRLTRAQHWLAERASYELTGQGRSNRFCLAAPTKGPGSDHRRGPAGDETIHGCRQRGCHGKHR